MGIVSSLAAKRFDRGGHPSVRAAVYDALRNEVVCGLLEPGKLLSIKDLQSRFGVGLSAIREALCQLAADGLVSAEEQRGFRVAPVSARDLEDVTNSRVEIEVYAIRDAIANGDTNWEAQLLGAYHRLTRAPKGDEGYAELHETFHDVLVSPCRSEWMKRFRKTLQKHSDRYRRLAATLVDEGRDIDGEHRALMESAICRDVERASTILAEHVRETARILQCRGLTNVTAEGIDSAI